MSRTRASGQPAWVSLLTGGDDPHYAHGLARALLESGIQVEFVGSDRLDAPFLHDDPRVEFLNLRGDQTEEVPAWHKVGRILRYYARLLRHAVDSRARVFHVLWNNKFDFVDRVLLMAWYRLCGRRIVLTAHNVNVAARDGHDSAWNRATLRYQYRACSHIFVHTELMRAELVEHFGVDPARVSLIPFGLNDAVPVTSLSRAEARARLGFAHDDKVALAFGQIAPYKGVEFAVEALGLLGESQPRLKLLVAGKVKQGQEAYWAKVEKLIGERRLGGRVTRHVRHIPDEDIEVYFKCADVLLMPYVNVFQSGVLFLGYSFGLPVVASDAGSLDRDVEVGRTGYVCRSGDPVSLARAIERFFGGELYANAEASRAAIKAHLEATHSWSKGAEITSSVYRRLGV